MILENRKEIQVPSYFLLDEVFKGDEYKARFCGSGMRWSRPGAERLCPVRSAILSNRFDRMWNLAYNSPPN